jgi:transposase
MVRFVYEAGFSGFHLYRQLLAHDYECIVTPPNRVPQTNDKVKTDKRDAQKLAQYLASGILKRVYVPPLAAEADRQIIRLRKSSQKKLTRVKNQIKSFLNLHSIKWSSDNGNSWSKKYLSWLESLEFEFPNQRLIVDEYLNEYHFLRDQIAKLTRQLREMSKQDRYSTNFKRLVSCKGVGLITAMTFLLELHELLRFPSAEKFCSYLGLTPSQFSTGDHKRLGHITREGNAHVRCVLVEAAWTVIRHDPILREKYDRIRAKGTNGKKAIVAVARSLAVRLRRCLLDDIDYVIGVC